MRNKLFILAALAILCGSVGCNTPRKAWALAANTYIATVDNVTILSQQEAITLPELEEFNQSRELADAALDMWAAALLTGTDRAEAIARFNRALTVMIARQFVAERRAPAPDPAVPIKLPPLDIPRKLYDLKGVE